MSSGILMPSYRGLSKRPFAYSVGGSASSGTDESSYNFANVNYGLPASSTRLVVGLVFGKRNGSVRSISACSIGGVVGTVVGMVAASGNPHAGIFYAVVPTGTQGNVAVTLSGTMDRFGVELWSLDGLDDITPAWTASDTSAPHSVPANIPAGGIALFSYALNVSSSSIGWTNATPSFNAVVEGNQCLTGYRVATAAEPATNVSVNSVGEPGALIGASWR